MEENEIIRQAKLEFEQELFRDAVEKYKVKLKNKRTLWDRIFPFKVLIIKKGNENVGFKQSKK